MSSNELEDALAKARDNLKSGLVKNEAGVQAAVIRPILRELGWDDADPGQWQVEYPVDDGRVDEALLGSLGTPLVFIEAKRPGNLNPKAEDQLFGYAANQGVPILVLTDGDTWDLYLSMAAGKPTERRFAHLGLIESDDLGLVARDLREFVARDAVWSGKNDDAAKARLKQVKDREIGKSGLEAAWAELLQEPDDILRDLLIERVEQRIGARPALPDAERFLRGLQGYGAAIPPSVAEPAVGGDVAQPQPVGFSERPPKNDKLRGFTLRGERYAARNAAAVVALLADTLASINPTFLERWANSGKGRTLPRAIRLGHPLLADPKRGAWYTRLPQSDEWYVMTSVNGKRKLIMMQDMAAEAGLARDADVRPILG
ncbi:hypothetical protein [Candidatus Poriferisodalis sp.]|uniref:hypothetical protein n=1 Tax=Candidatus Poriferisodalis sp. TaxID=3101277 RepID=UPI003B01E94B